jgi:uncharacterized protein (TIGR02217 family)
MAFDEIRLPDDIERGAQGGPRFKTRVLDLESGFEKRNQDWEQARSEWDLSYGIMQLDTDDAITHVREVLTFFYARRGRARGFRFKDWADFMIGDTLDITTRQEIGLGDGATTVFQINKRYTDAVQTYTRDIFKIVSGTDRLWLNEVEKTRVAGPPSAGEYSIDINTGVVTTGDVGLATGGGGPGGEHQIEVICEFDVPVRFKNDNMDINLQTAFAGSIPAIPIRETRIESTV